jgi:hypothetical protein
MPGFAERLEGKKGKPGRVPVLRQRIMAKKDERGGVGYLGVLVLGLRCWCWSGEISLKPQ